LLQHFLSRLSQVIKKTFDAPDAQSQVEAELLSYAFMFHIFEISKSEIKNNCIKAGYNAATYGTMANYQSPSNRNAYAIAKLSYQCVIIPSVANLENCVKKSKK
jgi:hypothetical protein